jgi:outer membrane murein-binding lipoprotein Lpp
VNAESKKVTELTAKVAELEAGKDDGSKDELTKTIEKLTADLNAVTEQQKAADSKATRLEREKAVGAKVRDPKLARLAYLDAEQKMAGDESLTFEEALEAVIESDPDYQRDENADEDTAVVVSTGKPVQGKPATDKFKAAIDSVFDEAAPEK